MLIDHLPKRLMQAILLPLIEEFLLIAGIDSDAAWEAAEAATMTLNPRTVLEFRLAVRVALYNILANRLVAQAGIAGLTAMEAVRVHRCALTYAKEADKAELRLEKLQAMPVQEQTKQYAFENVAADPTSVPAERPVGEDTQTIEDRQSVDARKPTEAQQPADVQESIESKETQAANMPAYKRLKQERRLAKQRERQARLEAQADAVEAIQAGDRDEVSLAA